MSGNRFIGTAFLAGALALLVAVPGVLAVAGLKDWRWLTAAAVVVPVATLFAGIWKARFERTVQNRETLSQEVTKGSFTPGGRLPRVREITDPITIGVHPAPRRETGGSDDAEESGAGGDRVPVYVPRDIDTEVCRELERSGFVLLVGDSAAGKSRAAFEAVRAMLADHTLIVPAKRDGVAAAVQKAATIRRCVLWLNDLESYLGSGGLTRNHVTELVTGTNHHRMIVATLRAAEEHRFSAATEDEEGRQLQRDSSAVLEQAHRIFVERRFSAAERQRASDLAGEDSRIGDALGHADTFGVAEYLACGPQLLAEWDNAWAKGTHSRAAALIAAAVDIRRAGYTAPLSKALLEELHGGYLDRKGGARLHPESLDQAWEWATRPRSSGNAPLHASDQDTYEVFDYLVDTMQRRAPAGQHVPEATITCALSHADSTQASNLATTAYAAGWHLIAESAIRQALSDFQGECGPDHANTLNSRSDLARMLWDMWRLEEAEAESRTTLDIRVRTLGPEHPDTLSSRNDLASILRDLGRLDEAEAEHRAVTETMARVLGSEHPRTLISRSNLASVLWHRGQLDKFEAESRVVMETMVGVLGPEHLDALISRHLFANALRDLGRLDEAEAEHRAVTETMVRVLGPEHPNTLSCRGDLAIVLRDLGRSEEFEAESRAVMETMERVLGPQHPNTLSTRSNLASDPGVSEHLE